MCNLHTSHQLPIKPSWLIGVLDWGHERTAPTSPIHNRDWQKNMDFCNGFFYSRSYVNLTFLALSNFLDAKNRHHRLLCLILAGFFASMVTLEAVATKGAPQYAARASLVDHSDSKDDAPELEYSQTFAFSEADEEAQERQLSPYASSGPVLPPIQSIVFSWSEYGSRLPFPNSLGVIFKTGPPRPIWRSSHSRNTV